MLIGVLMVRFYSGDTDANLAHYVAVQGSVMSRTYPLKSISFQISDARAYQACTPCCWLVRARLWCSPVNYQLPRREQPCCLCVSGQTSSVSWAEPWLQRHSQRWLRQRPWAFASLPRFCVSAPGVQNKLCFPCVATSPTQTFRTEKADPLKALYSLRSWVFLLVNFSNRGIRSRWF